MKPVPLPPAVTAAASHFAAGQEPLEIRPHGGGHIHDTFLVIPKDPRQPPFILQRLNTRVFPDPRRLLHNLLTVTAHVARRLAADPLPAGRRFELPRPLSASQGQHLVRDDQGRFWRALSFISGSITFETIQDPGHAAEVGCALGLFHRLVADLPAASLLDPLPGFHHTPLYLQHYENLRLQNPGAGTPEERFCHEFIQKRRELAFVLERAKVAGHLRESPVHGDPKVDNVLLDQVSRQAVALVDLDTVKPGLRHQDLGDCLRSGCNPLGEDPPHWEEVRFETELARAILRGYLDQARAFLTEGDRPYLYPAIRLLPFELGLRFFTDYLAGNVYFKTRDPEQNLRRALVQFQLTASIEAQAPLIEKTIRDLWPRSPS